MTNFNKFLPLYLLVLSVFLTLKSECLFSEDHSVFKEQSSNLECLSDLDHFVEMAIKDLKIPGVGIGIVANGEVVLAKGYGCRNKDLQLPVTENTLFAIGSCTKAFTTFLLGNLVEEGLIEWDMPVIHYIPEFKLSDPYLSERITVRDLITHRTGLARHDFIWYKSNSSREEIIAKLEYLEPICNLREKAYYNNLMYMVAGHLFERISKQSWEDAVSSRIFLPLKMNTANCSITDTKKSVDFALPFTKRNGEVKDVPFVDLTNIAPAGSINASVKDMVNWVRLQLSDGTVDGINFINTDTLREMHTSQVVMSERSCYPVEKGDFVSNYGLGWFIQAYRGNYHVCHNGAIDGFVSQVSLLPHENLGVVILTNCDSLESRLLCDYVTAAIFDSFLGMKSFSNLESSLKTYIGNLEKESQNESDLSVESERGSLAEEQQKEYIGVYEHPAYGSMRVQCCNSKLSVVFNNMHALLKHKHNTTFYGDKGPFKAPGLEGFTFSFQSDSSGSIVTMSVPLEPMGNEIIFTKKID